MKLFSKNQIQFGESLPKKFLSIDTVKPQSCNFRAFLKNSFMKELFFLKKPFFNQNFWKKSDFESLFFKRCQTLSQFSTTRQSSNRKIYRFRKKILTMHQILKWNCFVKKQILMKVLLSQNHFWIFLTRESANFCSYAPSQKPRIGGVIEKKQVSNQNLSKGSYFEATFSEPFTLWIKILKTCSNLTQF